MDQLSRSLIENLRTIITHCKQKQGTELTPNDVGYKELSFEELDDIIAFAKDL
ncbi:Gramicidin S synthase 1 [compost metagenome]